MHILYEILELMNKSARQRLEEVFQKGWQVEYIDRVVPIMEEYASQQTEAKEKELSDFKALVIRMRKSQTYLSATKPLAERIAHYSLQAELEVEVDKILGL